MNYQLTWTSNIIEMNYTSSQLPKISYNPQNTYTSSITCAEVHQRVRTTHKKIHYIRQINNEKTINTKLLKKKDHSLLSLMVKTIF